MFQLDHLQGLFKFEKNIREKISVIIVEIESYNNFQNIKQWERVSVRYTNNRSYHMLE